MYPLIFFFYQTSHCHKSSDQKCLLLTHLPLDKMAAILADNIFQGIFMNESDKIPI